MKTAELTGALLDYWVARAEGVACVGEDDEYALKEWGEHGIVWYTESGERGGIEPLSNRGSPSTDWAHGGPIIEREGISPMRWEVPNDAGDLWTARNLTATVHQSGPTALIAAMRAYVASKFGEEVQEP